MLLLTRPHEADLGAGEDVGGDDWPFGLLAGFTLVLQKELPSVALCFRFLSDPHSRLLDTAPPLFPLYPSCPMPVSIPSLCLPRHPSVPFCPSPPLLALLLDPPKSFPTL